MKSFFTTTALASAIAVGGIFAATPSFAQDEQPCVGENCPTPDMQGGQGTHKKRLKGTEQNNQGGDQSTDQMVPRKKRRGTQQQNNDVNVDVQGGSSQRMRHTDWKFDPGRHHRRRSRSAEFRFYFGGYWYPQPYWEIYGGRRYGVSCGEGRAIVAERFDRVRVVECRGGIYTYLGRRHGDTFRILLNSRSGRIVGRAMI